MLLGTTFIGEQILAIMPDERKDSVRDSNLVAMIKQGTTPVNALPSALETGKMTSQTLYGKKKMRKRT